MMIFVKSADDLRQSVLDASLSLIEEKGLSALSLREAARMAGVSHQAPYHHFGDREGILAALAEDGFARLKAEMEKATAKAQTPTDRLHAIGVAYVRFALGHPAHFKLMFRSELIASDKHCGLRESADATFDLLVAVVDDVALARWGRKDETLPLAAWSLAHGIATLILESKFDKKFGKSRRARQAGAEAILKAFGTLLESR